MSSQSTKVEIVNDDQIVIHKTITLKCDVRELKDYFKYYKKTGRKDRYFHQLEELYNEDFGYATDSIKHFELNWNDNTGDLMLDIKDDMFQNVINEGEIDEILKALKKYKYENYH